MAVGVEVSLHSESVWWLLKAQSSVLLTNGHALCSTLSAVSSFLIADLTKQCACMKFHFKLKETASEAYEVLKRALGVNAMAENQISEWFSQFKHNDTSAEECVQFYHAFRDHTEQNMDKVWKIISELMKQHSRGYWQVRPLVRTCQLTLSMKLNVW